jgi:hypothetical protein
MQPSEVKQVLTPQEIAMAVQEFDALWALPGTPERERRMEVILNELTSQMGQDAL